jgi:hypothetical protein
MELNELQLDYIERFLKELYENYPSRTEPFMYCDDALSLKDQHEVIKFMLRKGIIENNYAFRDTLTHSLTQLGLDIIGDGGYSKYLDRINKEKISKKAKEKLEFVKLQHDTTNSKWRNKTHWPSFIFATIAFIYTLVKIISDLFNTPPTP